MEKRKHLPQIVLGKLDVHMPKNKSRSTSITLYKTYSKWIKDINVKPETVKLLEENTNSSLYGLIVEKDFLDRTSFVQ